MADVVIKSDTGAKPPIVSSPDNQAERERFLAYFDSYIAMTPVQAAEVEQQKLTDYFTALDKRLTRAGPVEKGGLPKPFSVISFFTPSVLRDYKPKDRYQSGELRSLFTEIAKQTRSIVLSEVMICPESMIHDNELHSREAVEIGGLESTLLSSHTGDWRTYSFGFFDIRHLNPKSNAHDWEKYESAIGVPVLALNDDMLKAVSPYASQALLKPLQDVITLCNHDMMHNMVNTISRGDISRLTEAHFKSELKNFMEHKTGHHDPNHALGFESALVVGHARTWRDLKLSATGEQMENAVEAFYDQLERIAAEMAQDPTLSVDERHKAIDYFGMSIPYALARMVPLDDPLMGYALRRLEGIDPTPEQVLNQETYIDLMRNSKETARTLKNYKLAGTPLAQNEDGPYSYAEVRKLQLVRILPAVTILLSPGRRGSQELEAHNRSDEMDRDIVNIILGHHTGRPV